MVFCPQKLQNICLCWARMSRDDPRGLDRIIPDYWIYLISMTGTKARNALQTLPNLQAIQIMHTVNV